MVIIQNQNVEVYARIMPSMVKALKLCDAMESNWRNQMEMCVDAPAQELAPAATDDRPDPIEICCSWFFENKLNWQKMQDLMRARYREYVVGQFKIKTDAVKWLGVGSTYLCKLSKTVPHAICHNQLTESRAAVS